MSEIGQRNCTRCERVLTPLELGEARKLDSHTHALLCAACLYRRRLNNRRRVGVVLALILVLVGWRTYHRFAQGGGGPECGPPPYTAGSC
jgi:hypothetical protein